MDSSSENARFLPEKIMESVAEATSELLPTKSKSKYMQEFQKFSNWCKEQNVDGSVTEDVLLAYFWEISKKYKGSTLWTIYSMLKATLIIEKNLNISKFGKLIAFIKRKAENQKPKKSKILNKQQIETFMLNAPNKSYLMTKVCIYFR